jgi:hypothetical protein
MFVPIPATLIIFAPHPGYFPTIEHPLAHIHVQIQVGLHWYEIQANSRKSEHREYLLVYITSHICAHAFAPFPQLQSSSHHTLDTFLP